MSAAHTAGPRVYRYFIQVGMDGKTRLIAEDGLGLRVVAVFPITDNPPRTPDEAFAAIAAAEGV